MSGRIGATLLLLLLGAPARAEGPPHYPGSMSAARQVVVSGSPGGAPVTAALASGFGYSGADLGQDDRHLRLMGRLALESRPLPWLALGLRLDGRYDHHRIPAAAEASDDGWMGEPRLTARLMRPLADGLSGAVALSVLLPGSDAPSIEPAATTPELLASLTKQAGSGALTGNVGYRLDRTAQAAADTRLGPGDRLALGASDFDAALLRAAADFPVGGLLLFGEWSWDVLLGSGAPGPGQSPMSLGAGARAALSTSVSLELLARTRILGGPDGGSEGPLLPVPPRFEVLGGLLVSFGSESRERQPGPPPPPSAPAEPPPADLVVTVAGGPDERTGIRVEATTASGRFVLTPRPDGSFHAPNLPPGPAEVIATAEGFEEAAAAVRFEPGRSVVLPLSMRRRLPSGQIRGVVRSFGGAGLPATVHITRTSTDAGTGGPWEVVGEDGHFELEVPPGRYLVVIEAAGYRSQSRRVTVEENGVTVLNADLRALR